MTTFLLVWYSCGWAATALEAISGDCLTLGDIASAFLWKFTLVPAFVFACPIFAIIYLLDSGAFAKVLWRKP